MDGSSLDLVFKSELYKDILHKKTKKNTKQFGYKFIKDIKESSKFGK